MRYHNESARNLQDSRKVLILHISQISDGSPRCHNSDNGTKEHGGQSYETINGTQKVRTFGFEAGYITNVVTATLRAILNKSALWGEPVVVGVLDLLTAF